MTIPASLITKINPGVVNAGGAGLVLNGLFLTESTLMFTGQVLGFGSLLAVQNFFGIGSTEALAAAIYFNGYTNATLSPATMLFAAYNVAARSAFMNSGSFAGVPLTTIQALDGTLTITIAGTPLTSATINLSGATSFSNAAALIIAGFTSPGFNVTYSATTNQFVVTSTATGSTETIAFATGTIAAGLQLTQATGAQLSQGAALDTPTSAMNNAYAASQNWVTMVTLFEPNLANKELFAAWFNEQDDAFLWLAWDTDAQASVQNATEPFGVVAIAAAYEGVACIGADPAILSYIPPNGTVPLIPAGTTLATLVMNIATFVAGAIASINFGQTNGAVNITFLSQSGLFPTCANQQTYLNLLANGYSCYGAFTTRNQGFTFFTNSNLPGKFKWINTYVNSIWLNDQFQVTAMTLLTTIGELPYTPPGYGILRAAWVGGPIAQGLNFGAIRAGVVLSSTQIAFVNQLAGQKVDDIISTLGWYLQILDPGAVVRQERGTPICNFFYTDGGSIQMITLLSDDVL